MGEPLSVERLVRLGLTRYEARAYVALVRRDASTPAEVARMASVPKPRIYDVLQSLVGKGLAANRPGRTAKFIAAAPERAAGELVQAHRDRVASLEGDARHLVDELHAAYEDGRQHTDPLDYIEVIRSPEAIATRFNELQRSVEREMLVFSKPPATVSIEDNVVGLELARRGVLRSMYEFSILEDQTQLDGVRAFLDAGEQARFVAQLPLKLGIIDERTVLFAMPDPVAGSAEITTLVIENPHLASTLKIAFQSLWATGLTFTKACQNLGIPTRRRSTS
jgi:sugar-specific transcriptional regulator TrmB